MENNSLDGDISRCGLFDDIFSPIRHFDDASDSNDSFELSKEVTRSKSPISYSSPKTSSPINSISTPQNRKRKVFSVKKRRISSYDENLLSDNENFEEDSGIENSNANLNRKKTTKITKVYCSTPARRKTSIDVYLSASEKSGLSKKKRKISNSSKKFSRKSSNPVSLWDKAVSKNVSAIVSNR